jgi:hypothetical protein
MKLNGHLIGYGILIIVVLFLLNMVLTPSKGSPVVAGQGGGWTVYGTHGCGWTRKQLEVMKSKQIPHTFIDCDKEDCKGAEGFPTLVSPSGAKTTGFKEDF